MLMLQRQYSKYGDVRVKETCGSFPRFAYSDGWPRDLVGQQMQQGVLGGVKDPRVLNNRYLATLPSRI